MEKIDTARILRESFALLRANLIATLGALGVLVVAATAADLYGVYNPAMNFGLAAVTLFAQFGVTRAALDVGGLREEGTPSRPGSFLGALILTGLGMLLGFVFLILPGIYLWARWSLVGPLVLGEGMRSSEAISESWARTQSLVAPITAALLIFSVPTLLFFVSLVFYPEAEPTPIGLALISNLLTYVAQVMIWNCVVAIYGMTRAPSSNLEEVFA